MAGILLIDDDDAFRGMLRQVLEREGYQVEEARNGLNRSTRDWYTHAATCVCSSARMFLTAAVTEGSS
jgi:CheY-like chemotaxis protein